MIATFFRSSSFNCHEMCPMQYFIEYNLGWRMPANIKADMGTIVHKVLEILAIYKKSQQDGLDYFEDVEIYGNRKPKNNKIDVDKLISKVYIYYTKKLNHHVWTEEHFDTIKSWVWKALTFNNGMFDPRKLLIKHPEMEFNFDINEPWAKYSYSHQGSIIEGNLALKGTIDLIVEHAPGYYEIIDWKTGKRYDWAKDEEKSHEKLNKDPQLMLYHYAACKILPDVQQVMVTINFINDGGPFTVSFDNETIIKTEKMLRDKFEKIKQTQIPQLNRSWKCTKLCAAGKNTFEGTSIKPIVEGRVGKTTSQYSIMSRCEQTLYQIEKRGIDWVQENMMEPNHQIGYYKSPGSVE